MEEKKAKNNPIPLKNRIRDTKNSFQDFYQGK